jgi:hypothetical protein
MRKYNPAPHPSRMHAGPTPDHNACTPSFCIKPRVTAPILRSVQCRTVSYATRIAIPKVPVSSLDYKKEFSGRMVGRSEIYKAVYLRVPSPQKCAACMRVFITSRGCRVALHQVNQANQQTSKRSILGFCRSTVCLHSAVLDITGSLTVALCNILDRRIDTTHTILRMESYCIIPYLVTSPEAAPATNGASPCSFCAKFVITGSLFGSVVPDEVEAAMSANSTHSQAETSWDDDENTSDRELLIRSRPHPVRNEHSDNTPNKALHGIPIFQRQDK